MSSFVLCKKSKTPATTVIDQHAYVKLINTIIAIFSIRFIVLDNS